MKGVFTMKRIICILLSLLIAAALLAACRDTSDASDPDNSVDVSASGDLFANLPDVNYTVDGEPAEFVILTTGDWAGRYKSIEICANEQAPELISDSVTERNAMVEERFGVKIIETRTAAYGDMLTLIRNNASSGTDLYDVVMPFMTDAAVLSAEKLFYDLNTSSVSFDGEWWDQNAKSTLSIDKKLYFITGDLCLLAYDCTSCLAFNKDMIDDYNLDNPYELVDSGEWTLDKLLSMAREVGYHDNGDAKKDFSDIWGCMINSSYATSMFISSGERLTDKDENDIPTIAVSGDRQSDVFAKIFDLCSDSSICHIDSYAANYDDVWLAASEAIATGHVVFRPVVVIDIQEVASFDCNFGIIPTPKYDAEQEEYYSYVSAVCATCVAIPTSNEDFEMASVIMDAMAQASTDTVKTAYYDTLLKLRKIQDDDGERMLDIIFGGRVYDYGILFGWGGINTFMNDIAFSGSNTFQSKLDSITGAIQSDINNTVDRMR